VVGDEAVDRQLNLFEVVDAPHAKRGLACPLDGGQDECDQKGDDCDHDNDFEQSEAFARGHDPPP
jgi:hypothetical protein